MIYGIFHMYIIVFIYHFYKIFKYKRNPFKEDVHFDLKAYKNVIEENKEVCNK